MPGLCRSAVFDGAANIAAIYDALQYEDDRHPAWLQSCFQEVEQDLLEPVPVGPGNRSSGADSCDIMPLASNSDSPGPSFPQ
jgi:hypothetical protein